MKRKRKFNNKKTTVDGHTFDSKKEAKRYGELKTLEQQGKITGLEIQPRYLLQESFQDAREGLTKAGQPKTVRAIHYTADFQYKENGVTVVEDVKSEITRTERRYKLMKKLFLFRYRDVEFREI